MDEASPDLMMQLESGALASRAQRLDVLSGGRLHVCHPHKLSDLPVLCASSPRTRLQWIWNLLFLGMRNHSRVAGFFASTEPKDLGRG